MSNQKLTVYKNEFGFCLYLGKTDCLCLNSTPDHPQCGVSQCCEGKLGAHNGEEIPFSELPENVRNHAKDRGFILGENQESFFVIQVRLGQDPQGRRAEWRHNLSACNDEDRRKFAAWLKSLPETHHVAAVVNGVRCDPF